MFAGFLNDVGQLVQTKPWLAFAGVFLGGVLSSASPCVLTMIPLMIGFVAGRKEEGFTPFRAFAYTCIFVLGLSASFMALGISAALAGRLYGDVSSFWSWVVAAVCLGMGLHLIGVLRFTIPMPFDLRPRTRGALGALSLGLLFGVASAPCAAPVLIVVLTYLAGSGASVPYGAGLLLAYGLGHSVLILAVGSSMGFARRLLESPRFSRASLWVRRASGVAILGLGLYFVFSSLTRG